MAGTQFPLKTRGGLAAFLKGKPRHWSVAIASRASLRVLPVVLRGGYRSRTPDPKLLLASIRANFIAWIASRSEDYRGADYESVIANVSYASSYAVHYDRAAPGYAVGAAASAVDAARQSVDIAAKFASEAAASAASAGESIWPAISADAQWLAAHERSSGVELTRQPLWLIEVRDDPKQKANLPRWARDPLDAFNHSEWVVEGPWGVWLAWYREMLPNHEGAPSLRLFNEKTAFRIANQPSEFWEGDPHRVTAAVAKMVGYQWPESHWKWPDEQTKEARQLQKRAESKSGVSSASDDSPSTSQAPVPIETVGIHSDEPTDEDQLGRWPFAKALAEHMDDVYWQQKARAERAGANPDDGDGFAMHVHAPWGAGKTSVIKMMRKMLERNDRPSKNGRVAPQWIVVEFNAWRNERRNPPWWPLTEEIYGSCSRGLEAGDWAQRFIDRRALQFWWLWWKTCTVWLPFAVAGLVLISAAYFLWANWGQGAGNNLENLLKVITAFGAVVVIFIGVSRFAVFGSTANAKVFEDLSQDPMKRLALQFKRIVETTNMPICIVIDDLDRCQSQYVVSLLQGVQTIFRHRSVTYLVAADRSWIKTSFENQYKDLKDTVGSASQPLGYLFLEKVFQVSTPLPAVSAKMRAAYWEFLLQNKVRAEDGADATVSRTPVISEQAVETERLAIRAESGNLTRAEADRRLKEKDTPTVRAALALELSTSSAATAEATHLLAEFRDCVPEIPRMMKRMLNAYAVRQAMGVITHDEVPVKALARWTIIEQSEPALADALNANPELVNGDTEIPDDHPFAGLLRSSRFEAIARGGTERLTPAHIRRITRGDDVAGLDVAAQLSARQSA